MQDVDRTEIAIKYNNLSAAEPCGICGGVADHEVGLGLFLAKSWNQVCWPCGRQYAPELTAMLLAWLESHPEGIAQDPAPSEVPT